MIEMNSVATIEPGSITAELLAESAVVLESSKVTGKLPNAKLGDDAVDTVNLVDGAVTLDKAEELIRSTPLITNANEASVTGTTEAAVKSGSFQKNSGNSPYVSFAVNAQLKVDNPASIGSLKVYIDSEASPRATLTTQATSYDALASGYIDISDLSNGQHTVTVKLVNDTAGAKVTNKLFEFFAVK